MSCNACRIFLLDSLPFIKFISPIQYNINREKWIKYSSEIVDYCLEFTTICSKPQYDHLYNNIMKHMKETMPDNKDLQQNNISEHIYVNVLLNIDRILQDVEQKYKSLKNHAFATIQERHYIPNVDIEIEIIWLSSIAHFMSVYNEVHIANPSHLKN